MLTNRESSGILVNHRATSESTTRVLTETCAFGTCKNDSRYMYYESWKRNPNGDPMKVFHFPGAVRQSARRRKRIQACHRGDSFVLTEDSYICSLHFVGVKWGWKAHMTPTVRGICTFAVSFSVSRPLCRFTLVYEGHFVLCHKEK